MSGDGPFTVFAPTDDAFAALPAGTVESLLLPENLTTLQDILKYHVVPAKVLSTDLTLNQHATTLEGSDVTVTSLDPVKINESEVIQADVMASNGVVHVLDAVLMPPSDEELELAHLATLPNWQTIPQIWADSGSFANIGQILEGSFSAVSKPIFAS